MGQLIFYCHYDLRGMGVILLSIECGGICAYLLQNPTLEHYSCYKAADLKTTVIAMQDLQLNNGGCQLNAIREKYRNQKVMCQNSKLVFLHCCKQTWGIHCPHNVRLRVSRPKLHYIHLASS